MCRKYAVPLAVLSVIFLVGCQPIVRHQEYGSIVVTLNPSLAARTIEPPLDMNPDSYYISATGPGAPYTATIPAAQPSVTITDLLAGDWSITVVARNAAVQNIGGGIDDFVTVVAGQVTPCTIVVRPFSGTGSLSLAVSWPDADVFAPSVSATLAPLGGSAAAVAFTTTGNPRTYSGTWDAGYYELNIQLSDGGTKVWGTAAAVRIIAGQVSSGSFELTSSDINPLAEGSVALTIQPDMRNSIVVSFGSTPSTYYVGDPEMSIAASTLPADGGSFTYRWFLNGTALAATGSTLSLGNGLSVGNYTLALVVTDGTVRSGSSEFLFSVLNGYVRLPRTGQTQSYAGGDDGDLQKGMSWPEPRFTNNGDGTITDHLTGLMWDQNGSRFGSGRTWAQAVSDANGLTLAGHSDWRLPNRGELMSLVNYSSADNIAWLTAQGFFNITINDYWSSTTYARSTDTAWPVHMRQGISTPVIGNKTSTNTRVLAVRTAGAGTIRLPRTGQTVSYASGDDGDLEEGVAWPATRFGDNGDGTISDNLTGLTWDKTGNRFGQRTWVQALTDVSSLSLAGHDDWRLPNMAELRSLVNAAEVDPAAWLNGHSFSGVLSDWYWSSNTDPADTSVARLVNFYGGHAHSTSKTSNVPRVLAVRGGE